MYIIIENYTSLLNVLSNSNGEKVLKTKSSNYKITISHDNFGVGIISLIQKTSDRKS